MRFSRIADLDKCGYKPEFGHQTWFFRDYFSTGMPVSCTRWIALSAHLRVLEWPDVTSERCLDLTQRYASICGLPIPYPSRDRKGRTSANPQNDV